jgi:hypothetical protein
LWPHPRFSILPRAAVANVAHAPREKSLRGFDFDANPNGDPATNSPPSV